MWDKYNKNKDLSCTYGLQFFPESYNYCKRKLEEYYTSNLIDPNLFSGKWLLFGKGQYLHDIMDQLESKQVDLQLEGIDQIRVVGMGKKSMMMIRCGPFFDPQLLKNNLTDLVKAITTNDRQLTSTLNCTAFYKPEILRRSGITAKSEMKSYIFKHMITF